jgi:FkbM family methyltransferase
MLDTLNIHTIEREGILFSFVNRDEFEKIYTDIFNNGDYHFESDHADPHIIDCGSHIGISVLYFKHLYPNARIIAFEPHPENFKLLQQNVKQNNLRGVWLLNAAVADTHGEVEFFINQDPQNWWTLSGSINPNKVISESTPSQIQSKSMTLSSFINDSVDLIKLDVQSLEQSILEDIQADLTHVSQIKLEYHGYTDVPPNDLATIVSLLKDEGFDIQVTQEGKAIPLDQAIASDLHWIVLHARKTTV